MKNIKTKSILMMLVLFASCKTYHITTQSLLEQFANTQTQKKTMFVIAPPFFFPFMVTGNSLSEIKVLDKYDKEFIMPVNNHTGVRITKKDGGRQTFYFNTLIIQDSIITGKNDHFIGVNIKPIKLSNIEKIELQR
ncbi:MAG: hypothetical protein ABL940_03025 [Bacteroidia bacterium]